MGTNAIQLLLPFYWFLLLPSQECEGLTPKGWADWVTYSVIITHLGLAGLGRKDTSPCGSLWALIQPNKSGRLPHPPTPAHTACVMGLALWEGIFNAFSSVSTYMLLVSMLPETGHFYSFLLLGQQQSLLRQSVLGYRVIACSADVLPSKCSGIALGKCKPPNFLFIFIFLIPLLLGPCCSSRETSLLHSVHKQGRGFSSMAAVWETCTWNPRPASTTICIPLSKSAYPTQAWVLTFTMWTMCLQAPKVDVGGKINIAEVLWNH